MAVDDRATDVPELTATELEALHSIQLGIEHAHRAYADLLGCHHRTGHAMDRFADAERRLREAGHDAYADEIRDCLLPAGVVEDRWTYELVTAFKSGLLDELDAFEGTVRDDLAEGVDHVAERIQQQTWRERAHSDEWRSGDRDYE